MPQQVDFLGQMHEFPDNFSQEQIATALRGFTSASPAASSTSTPDTSHTLRTERTVVGARQEYVAEGELFPDLPKLNDAQRQYVDAIAEIETDGLEDRFIRTQVRPDEGGAGSSAYGPYQITHGLLNSTFEQSPQMFTKVEQEAVQELLERQEIALAIGGSDRQTYERGGRKHGIALRWAREYGFEDVDSFLDAFDYGGNLGLAEDGDFQTLYESFGRKMLLQNLRDANGDGLEAASVWHGGASWSTDHASTTEQYRDKYRRITGTN